MRRPLPEYPFPQMTEPYHGEVPLPGHPLTGVLTVTGFEPRPVVAGKLGRCDRLLSTCEYQQTPRRTPA